MASQPHTTTRQQSGPSSTRMILHFLFGKAINLLHPASSIAALYNAENTRNDHWQLKYMISFSYMSPNDPLNWSIINVLLVCIT